MSPLAPVIDQKLPLRRPPLDLDKGDKVVAYQFGLDVVMKIARRRANQRSVRQLVTIKPFGEVRVWAIQDVR